MQVTRWLGVALVAGAFAFAGCGDDEEEPPAAGGGVDPGRDRGGGREVPGGFHAGQDPGTRARSRSA